MAWALLCVAVCTCPMPWHLFLQDMVNAILSIITHSLPSYCSDIHENGQRGWWEEDSMIVNSVLGMSSSFFLRLQYFSNTSQPFQEYKNWTAVMSLLRTWLQARNKCHKARGCTPFPFNATFHHCIINTTLEGSWTMKESYDGLSLCFSAFLINQISACCQESSRKQCSGHFVEREIFFSI